MARSSGIPLGGGLGHIRKIVQSRQSPTEVATITYSTNEWDETTETETTTVEQLWLYQGTSRLVQELMGEQPTGTLNALGTTPIAVDLDDRLTYNGVEYEVVEKTPLPEEDPQMVALGCTERQS